MKTAIVYDRVNKWGGAERVLLALHEMFPDAPLYTSVYDSGHATWAKVFPNVYSSFLQKIPFAKNNHELFAVLMPLAFEQFDFSEYDLVISVTSEAAKGIITRPGTLHVCYCLTPTRYLWSGHEDYFKNPILRFLSKPFINYLKNWDKIAAQRPDKIISISTEVRDRVKRYYQRDSEIIFPPFQKLFTKNKIQTKDKNYYLVVSRLVPYKKVDLAIMVFNKLNKKLYIVGSGSQEYKLKLISNKNIKLLGNLEDGELAYYYQNAKALIMPQLEDFGIVSLEAQSFVVPVIAYAQGGSRDTVIDGVTGVLFDEQNEHGLQTAIEKSEKMSFNDKQLFSNVKRFSKQVFKEIFFRHTRGN